MRIAGESFSVLLAGCLTADNGVCQQAGSNSKLQQIGTNRFELAMFGDSTLESSRAP